MAEITGKEQFSASLFDITQDITGGLPLQVIGDWLDSGQSYEDALRLLEPHKVTGYSVSSDTAGLTRLTKEYGLLEILAIINQPKEIVYGYGTAIGGQGLGIWAADNTQMLYPPSVSAATLLSALLTMQDEIQRTCRVKIGLGAHYGEFYSLSGGLYGVEADAIEELSENETEGGEIVVTQSIYERLPADHAFTLEKRDNHSATLGDVYRLVDGPRLSGVQISDVAYPIPYSQAFYADLVEYQNRLSDASLGQQLAQKHLQNKAVVLIERATEQAANHELAMFTNLSLSALLKDTGLRLLAEQEGVEIKVAGPIGIYVFEQVGDASRFAQAFRHQMEREGVACRMGIDVGSVLVFDLAEGGKDIAGMPVNVASKMAQDKGRKGKIYLSAACKELTDVSAFTEIRYNVSGVEMVVYEG